MYYSITSQDAKKLALEEIRDITSKLNKETRKSPSGFRWIIPAALISLLALGYLEMSLGFGNLSSAFWQAVTFQKATAASSVEAAFQNSANKLVVQIDQTVVQAENFLRALFTFLWG